MISGVDLILLILKSLWSIVSNLEVKITHIDWYVPPLEYAQFIDLKVYLAESL